MAGSSSNGMAGSSSSGEKTVNRPGGFLQSITENPYPQSNSDAFLESSRDDFVDNLAKFVALENLPLNFGKKPTFENLCLSLNPAAERVPTSALEYRLTNLYSEGRYGLIDQFAAVKCKVSLSVEIWCDFWQVHSYVSVTCHWVDDSWFVQRRLLAFRMIVGERTAESICRTIQSVLDEYELTGKIFAVLLECIGSNIDSVEDLKAAIESSVGCKVFPFIDACRVLSLCARDGLQHVELQLRPIRQAIGYLWSNPRVMKHWGKFCKANSMEPEKFSREVPTRWDSTFLLLQKSLEYKELLSAFFAENVKEIHLCPNQWVVCEKLVPVKDEHSPEPTLIENDVREHLNNFYHEYKAKYGEKFTEPERQDTGDKDTGDSAKKFNTYEDFMKKVFEKKRRERKKFLEHELENYLENPFTANIEHVLQWWHASEDKFPVISRMAKEVLACPASTVSLEQVFHTGGNILSEKQSTMSPDCLEAQLCLGDWIKAGKITHTRDRAILIWWSKPDDSQ
ncbi:Unknown protein [Striga hermonthica]|uniref:HAT C-terminal dimerisation domain-containing protein n=1 Tax=Striga hermonthica TaxID=68872 RepID=A0A9N7R425_STRHE|nr:Unknown protein [Striga hermonthica]